MTSIDFGEEIKEVIAHYKECALWSSCDEDGLSYDNSTYANLELSPELEKRFSNDCTRFWAAYIPILHRYDYTSGDFEPSQVGHDFWLTRNGHGSGFWDGDWPKGLGAELTLLAKTFGAHDLYIGDNGKLY